MTFFSVPVTEAVKSQPHTLVSLSDPAIAWPDDEEKAAELRKRYLDRLDVSALATHMQGDPVLFVCRALGVEEFDAVQARAVGQAEGAGAWLATKLLAYKAACQVVRDVPTDDGTRIMLTGARRLEVPRHVRMEIGEYCVLLASRVSPDFT